MPVFRTPKGLVLFAHVPRAGGSSVENYLHGRFGTLAFLNRGHHQCPIERRWNSVSPQHVDRITMDLMMPPEFFIDGFAVVRHPVTRIESVFLYNLEVMGLIPPETRFEEWLEDLPAKRKLDPSYLDNHTRPMVDMIPPRCRIFRLEDGFSAVEAWIDELSGTKWPRKIGRVHARDQLLASKGLTPVPTIRTPESTQQIVSLFEADFEQYGYEPTNPHPESTLLIVTEN